MTAEIWKGIPGCEARYEVSNFGRVRSLVSGGQEDAKIMLGTNLGGYRRYELRVNGKRWCVFGHVLVLTAFVGPAPTGHEGCHNNGDRADNQLTNLRWDTMTGNQSDRLIHGTHNRGERSGRAKITLAQAQEIKARRAAGEPVRSISRDFNIGDRTVYHIAAGERWSEEKAA